MATMTQFVPTVVLQDFDLPQREAAFFYGLFLRGHSAEQLRRDIEVPQAVLLTVADQGMGIAANDLPHIFDRFYRGEHMPTYESPWKVPQGTGLGLTIARAIVQAHQGHIMVVSTPDAETIFTVKIPNVIG